MLNAVERAEYEATHFELMVEGRKQILPVTRLSPEQKAILELSQVIRELIYDAT